MQMELQDVVPPPYGQLHSSFLKVGPGGRPPGSLGTSVPIRI